MDRSFTVRRLTLCKRHCTSYCNEIKLKSQRVLQRQKLNSKRGNMAIHGIFGYSSLISYLDNYIIFCKLEDIQETKVSLTSLMHLLIFIGLFESLRHTHIFNQHQRKTLTWCIRLTESKMHKQQLDWPYL